MAQLRGLFGARHASRARSTGPSLPDRKPSPKAILCILPRRLRANPLKPLLKGYDLAAADTWASVLRLVRRQPHDLYLIYAPLGWAEPAEVCRRVRLLDRTTPLIAYSILRPSAEERQAVSKAGGQAYVWRGDDAHNIGGTAGQLIMLAELRSIEAVSAGGAAMEDKLVRRLSQFNKRANGTRLAQPEVHERLKIQTRRLFASAGGSPAHFERIWPSIYKNALERLTRNEG